VGHGLCARYLVSFARAIFTYDSKGRQDNCDPQLLRAQVIERMLRYSRCSVTHHLRASVVNISNLVVEFREVQQLKDTIAIVIVA
jgi:hypothetical protein